MADKPATIADVVQHLMGLTGALREHTALILALAAYLRAQPTYDAAHFGTLYAHEREQLGLPPTPVPDVDATLQALLRDFEGPPH